MTDPWKSVRSQIDILGAAQVAQRIGLSEERVNALAQDRDELAGEGEEFVRRFADVLGLDPDWLWLEVTGQLD